MSSHLRVLGVLIVALCSAAPSVAAAQPGAVDGGFGSGGVAVTGLGAERNMDFATDVVVLPDGRIVAAGTADHDQGPVAIGLVRHLPSGALDQSFGDGGRVVTNPMTMYGWALARQPDGRLVVGGMACDGTRCDPVVVRYTENGALDGSFGSGGLSRVEFGTCGDDPPRGAAFDLALDGEGRIVGAGGACTGQSTYNDPVAFRLRADGSPDPSFGDGGRAVVDLGDWSGNANGVAIDGDGRIVLGGGTSLGETPNLVARLTPGGRPDPSFDGDGVRLLPRAEQGVGVLQVGVLPDRRIVVSGTSVFEAVDDGWFVSRLLPDGSYDGSYDGDGTSVLRGRTAQALGMLVAPDGAVTLAGRRYEEGRGSHMAIARFTAGGALDPAFGSGGITFVPAQEESLARAIAAGPDGSLAVAGWAGSAEARYTFAVTRLLGEPRPAAPPPGPAVVDAPLRIPVRSRARVRLRRGGTFRLALGPFVEQVSGTAEVRLGPRRFARRTFRAARGGNVTVRLRASRRVRRLAARRRGVRVVARLEARDVRARFAARRFTFRLVRRPAG